MFLPLLCIPFLSVTVGGKREAAVWDNSFEVWGETEMKNVPADMEGFLSLQPWWRTEVPTEIIRSREGVGELLHRLEKEKKNPFFVVDSVLRNQPVFAPLFGQEALYLFDASASEPKTGDVDTVVSIVKSRTTSHDVVVGIGGGGTMDLAKAVGICLANPEPAHVYQGYGLDMKKGADIWVLPTLSGTGAEITPIAVLRGPEKKLGINNPYTAPSVAVIDPGLTSGVRKYNRFFTLMDCYFHHYEIMKSATSSGDAVSDALDGLFLSKGILTSGVEEFRMDNAVRSAMASILGGSSTIGGRVGAAHAISYGLSNSAPTLPHSVAVTIAMLSLGDIYPDGCEDTITFLRINGMETPKARDFGIGADDVGKMTKTALGMEKLWQSCFGDSWKERATEEYIRGVYERIVSR
ncbi:MAG: 3-deoxy-alpha-D-manno-octulosonate 8-oxidase [Synergistaceae bacterium]|nr:3-deoxy-alpha-D-manno-octulosonate 8-oxidase [Synergistaceae bacterium]